MAPAVANFSKHLEDEFDEKNNHRGGVAITFCAGIQRAAIPDAGVGRTATTGQYYGKYYFHVSGLYREPGSMG